jgi:hypothetical protein
MNRVAYYSTAPIDRGKVAVKIANLAAREQLAGPLGFQALCFRLLMDKKYSKHQQNIIRNYYDNRESISLQRLSELVTELYLAEGKGREKQWKFIVSALQKLEIPADRIEHLRKQDNPALLAKLVEELIAKQK